MIGEKEEIILKELSNKPKTLEELSTILKLSQRAVRYKIKYLNDYFVYEKIDIHIAVNKNFVQIFGDLNILDNFMFSKFNSHLFFQNERLDILENIFLFGSKKFKIEEYQSLCNISDSTAKKDYKLLRKNFNDMKIVIINRKYYTEIKSEKEEIIRNLMLNNIVKYKINSANLILKDKVINEFINEYFYNINFFEIKEILNKISEQLKIAMSDEAYNIIEFNFAIALKRAEKYPLNIKNIKNTEFLKGTEEYKVLNNALKSYNLLLDYKNNIAEILNITENILGSHSYNLKYSFYENWIHIASMVNKLIRNTLEYLNVGFKNDLELFEIILNHIKPMIYRIRKGIKLSNSIGNEIIKEYPEIFEALKNNINILEEFIEHKVDDDELGYLCVFFQIGIKKHQTNFIHQAVIVCNFGFGVSKILESRLKDRFNINIIETLPKNKLNKEDIAQNKIDLIITTVKLEDKYQIPIIKIRNPLLGIDDIKVLKQYGLKELELRSYYKSLMDIIYRNCDIKDENNLKNDMRNILGINIENYKYNKQNGYDDIKEFKDFMSLKNIKIIKGIKTFEEGIRIAGDILINLKVITKRYIESCIKIFKQNCGYILIGKNTILPHSDNFKSVKKTGYCFLKLRKPIVLKYERNFYDIENIILLASKDAKNHRSSLLDLKIMIDEYKLEKIIHNCNTEEELLEIIQNIKNK